MVKRSKSNATLINTIKFLQMLGRKSNLWADIAERLKRPRNLMAEVNLSKLSKYTSEDEVVVVPGKILGSGEISHSITVAALSFSKTAKAKLTKAECRCLSISELAELNPEGSHIKIVE
ncbi:50S ribosomal protein L18e [Candidatus Bathyarchaeota archaeon]|nr:50S ribosomal protein L18e [Candidatus Bathyarchaeota archaeon]MBS7618290.1 50S ribosomal protein L18e [Candidatus Bathyarchaeota archaeon]